MTMNEKMLHFIDHYGSSFFVASLLEKKVVYVNKTAMKVFGVTMETCDFTKIFDSSETYLVNNLMKKIESNTQTLYYNQIVVNGAGKKCSVDIQLGYFNEEKTEIFLEFIPCKDHRMEMALYQVNHATRPEAILNLDESLSIIHCNDPFHEVFESSEELRHSHFENQLINGFLPEVKGKLIKEIFENLKNAPTYSTTLKVFTAKGEERWYLFELEKRSLDDSGQEKIIAYMTNVEQQVELKAEHTLLVQQLSAMQELTDNILYHIDVKKGLLFHQVDLVRGRDVGFEIKNFVEFFVEQQIVHPDDAEKYQNFLKNWYSDAPSMEECTIRASVVSMDYQWYIIRGKKIYDENGVLTNVLGALVNVEKEKELGERYTSLNHIFTAFQKLSEDILFRIDVKTGVMYQTGDTETALSLGKEIPDYVNTLLQGGVIHKDDATTYLEFTKDISQGLEKECQVRVATSPTNYDWFQISVQPFYNDRGILVDLFGKMTNIQRKKDLERSASHDLMTSVLNKVSFEQEVAEVLQQSPSGLHHALIFVDLDDFKYVNDNYGHSFGDFLLTTVSKRLKRVVREHDLVGRLGGDEFALFLKSIGSAEAAFTRVNLLLETLNRPFSYDGKTLKIKASIGFAIYPQHGQDYAELIKKADIALYSSKGKGKNVATLYTEALEP